MNTIWNIFQQVGVPILAVIGSGMGVLNYLKSWRLAWPRLTIALAVDTLPHGKTKDVMAVAQAQLRHQTPPEIPSAPQLTVTAINPTSVPLHVMTVTATLTRAGKTETRTWKIEETTASVPAHHRWSAAFDYPADWFHVPHLLIVTVMTTSNLPFQQRLHWNPPAEGRAA